MKKRPTIIDVARLAGVSKSTAARAMSGGQHVSDEVLKTVQLAARRIGYRRNNLAVSMRSGRSGLVGIVLPDIANPFWAEVVRGAQDTAVSLGLSLLIFSSDWNIDREIAHLDALVRARVDGYILNTVSDGETIPEFASFGCPSLLIGTSADFFPELSSVRSDIEQGVQLALDHLTKMGHCLPKLILGSDKRLARAKFISAVNRYYLEREVDPTDIVKEDGEYTLEGGRKAMRRLLDSHGGGHLTIFAANDLMALGAILEAKAAGLRCPEKVSVVGFDGILAGELCEPPLTTVAKPAKQIGSTSMQLLKGLMDGEKSVFKQRLECQLIDRKSVLNLKQNTPLALSA